MMMTTMMMIMMMMTLDTSYMFLRHQRLNPIPDLAIEINEIVRVGPHMGDFMHLILIGIHLSGLHGTHRE